MGRPSKLSPQQWAEITRRAAAGEAITALAKEYGVNHAQVSRRVSHLSHAVRNAAEKLALGRMAVAALPVRQQAGAETLADQLQHMSTDLAAAGVAGARMARHLQELALGEAERVNARNLESHADTLKTAAVLTRMANDAAMTPTALATAKRAQLQEGQDVAEELPTVIRLVSD